MKPLTLLVAGSLLLASSRGLAQEEAEKPSPWTEDYAAAVKQARAEDKDLLVVFTGTDWIEICQVFHDEILTAPDFLEAASEHFVFVKLEFPRDNRLPRGLAQQNQLLRDAYRVRGFPTVVLTDPDGRPFGLNGYQPVTPAQYAGQMLSIRKAFETRRKTAAEAEGLEGLARAEKLAAGIPELPGNLSARYYREAMEEVVSLDPRNELKMTPGFRKLIADVDYSAEMQRLAADVQWGRMIELTDSYIRDNRLEGASLQKALLNKAGVQDRQANLEGRIGTLLAIVKIDPESGYGKEAQRQLDALRAEKLEEDLANPGR